MAAASNDDAYASSLNPDPSPPPVRTRARRATRACDFCHSRSIRCRPSESPGGGCQTCRQYDRRCTNDRPARKRGVKPNSQAPSDALDDDDDEPRPHALYPRELTASALLVLVDVHFAIVHPLLPFFHRASLLDRVARGVHRHDLAFFGAVMALCGLSRARVRDGAALPPNRTALEIGGAPTPERFMQLAEASVSQDPASSENLDHLRTWALLAVLALQDHDVLRAKFFLGVHHALANAQGLHQERSWPPSVGSVEVEERRRLFWSVYMVEMLAAAASDYSLVTREAHVAVQYPSSFHGDDSPPSRASPNARPPRLQRPHWSVGWSFLIDLYRVLENALDRHRALSALPHSTVRAFFIAHEQSGRAIFRDIAAQYARLPGAFKEIKPFKRDPHADQDILVATNIAATIQLVRMVLGGTEPAGFPDRLQTAAEVMQTFSVIPREITLALGAPLAHQLGAIGCFVIPAAQIQSSGMERDQMHVALQAFATLVAPADPACTADGHPSRRLQEALERNAGPPTGQQEQDQDYTTQEGLRGGHGYGAPGRAVQGTTDAGRADSTCAVAGQEPFAMGGTYLPLDPHSVLQALAWGANEHGDR